MDTNSLKKLLKSNYEGVDKQFKRLFHGRGGLYEGLNFLTVDSIGDILSVGFYFDVDSKIENEVLNIIKSFVKESNHKTILLQRRYLDKSTIDIIQGDIDDEVIAYENDLKFYLNLKSNLNSGYFGDMKLGREYIRSISKDKKVLNLFSYSCGFSLAALLGKAKSVVNFDMSKSALNLGRKNHHLNNLDTKKVKFYPHNILKSFSRIKRDGLYDIVIIDPPTFQKGSFEATKDYEKIIKRLDSFTQDGAIVLACLNSPTLDSNYLINLFKTYAPQFEFIEKLNNLKEYDALTQERSLKNLVFKKRESL